MTQEERRTWYAFEKAAKRNQLKQIIILAVAVSVCTAFLLGTIIEL